MTKPVESLTILVRDSLDMTKPVESLTKIVNKSLKLFTSWKVDITPHVEAVTTTLGQVYTKQARGNSFSSLSDKERKSLLARILEEELVNPVQAVWSVYSHVSQHRQCQEHLLCMVNHREFKNIKPLRPSEASPTRLAVTKASSLGVSWTLAKGNKDE